MILNYLSVLLIWLSVCLDDTELSVWTISPARISFGSIRGSGVTLLAFRTVLTKYTLGFPFTAFPIKWSSPWGIRCWRTWRGLSCTWWGRPRLCGGIFPGRNPGARLSDKRFLLLLHATVIWFYWGHLCTLIKCIFTPHWFFSKLSHDERFQSGCGWKNTSKAFLFHTYLPGTRALTWLGPRWEPKHRKQQEWQDGPWW